MTLFAKMIRPARMKDADALLDIKNDYDVRQFSIVTKDEIRREDHLRWLERALNNPDVRLFCICHGGGYVVGDVRLDVLAKDSIELSVRIRPSFRRIGIGIGTFALAFAITEAKKIAGDKVKLMAKIVDGNAASMALFKSVGFRVAYHDNVVSYLRFNLEE